ncbi:MAG: hypothetical protein E7223_01830 [Clostridiales bacterium]|nr:hypothetical protein [Clostridiales bacterium]
MKAKKKSIATVAVMVLLIAGLSLFCWFKPQNAFSDSERRALAKFPGLDFSEVLSGDFMSDFETYTQDQFPLRDLFRRIKAYAVLGAFQQKDNGDLYIADGYASKLEFPLNRDMLSYAADRFEFIRKTYLEGTGSKIYLSIVPDKNYFLAGPNGYPSMDYEELVETMKEHMDYATYIDIFPLLSLEDYYYTDTHWRQEAILDVAEALAKGMNAELTDTDYTVNTLQSPFYGVYYGQSALPLAPDTLKYLTSKTLADCILTSYNTGEPVVKDIYDMGAATGRDPYEMFMAGSDALLVVENPSAKTDKELILFRDSFSSSLSPLLVSAYSKITIVDIRYIPSKDLGTYIDFHGQDVLFLYSTMLLNNSSAFK